VLPDRFHRIRHYGLLASSTRKANIANLIDDVSGTPSLMENMRSVPVSDHEQAKSRYRAAVRREP
jgi:hypothetical protein